MLLPYGACSFCSQDRVFQHEQCASHWYRLPLSLAAKTRLPESISPLLKTNLSPYTPQTKDLCHILEYDCPFTMLPTYSLSLLMASLACALPLEMNRQSLSSRSPPKAMPSTLPRVSSLKGGDSCFDASTHPRLIPPQPEDCIQAALPIRHIGSLASPLVFSRQPVGTFLLPQVFRSGTCVISVDVVRDTDADLFPLWVVNNAALDLAIDCAGGPSDVGGKMFVGPKQVVYVMLFGRNPPPASAAGGFIQLVPNVTNNVTLERA